MNIPQDQPLDVWAVEDVWYTKLWDRLLAGEPVEVRDHQGLSITLEGSQEVYVDTLNLPSSRQGSWMLCSCLIVQTIGGLYRIRGGAAGTGYRTVWPR